MIACEVDWLKYEEIRLYIMPMPRIYILAVEEIVEIPHKRDKAEYKIRRRPIKKTSSYLVLYAFNVRSLIYE